MTLVQACPWLVLSVVPLALAGNGCNRSGSARSNDASARVDGGTGGGAGESTASTGTSATGGIATAGGVTGSGGSVDTGGVTRTGGATGAMGGRPTGGSQGTGGTIGGGGAGGITASATGGQNTGGRDVTGSGGRGTGGRDVAGTGGRGTGGTGGTGGGATTPAVDGGQPAECVNVGCPAQQVCQVTGGGANFFDGGWSYVVSRCIANPCAPDPPSSACLCSTDLGLCPSTSICQWLGGAAQTWNCMGRCAAPDTAVATPTGERPIAELRAGDWVYSIDHGQVIPVPVLAVSRTPVERHRVVRLTLETGRVVEMSACHPTADGRTFGDLRRDQRMGGLQVVETQTIPYPHPYTFDILPASDSAVYFAAGVPVGSTMSVRAGQCRSTP